MPLVVSGGGAALVGAALIRAAGRSAGLLTARATLTVAVAGAARVTGSMVAAAAGATSAEREGVLSEVRFHLGGPVGGDVPGLHGGVDGGRSGLQSGCLELVGGGVQLRGEVLEEGVGVVGAAAGGAVLLALCLAVLRLAGLGGFHALRGLGGDVGASGVGGGAGAALLGEHEAHGQGQGGQGDQGQAVQLVLHGVTLRTGWVGVRGAARAVHDAAGAAGPDGWMGVGVRRVACSGARPHRQSARHVLRGG
ncbi:hypothetical protein [Deinococcus aquaticus]|uniref:hypothetical protein n=1 Tax=Deinococcus aquaticus TaxID=328692 RepID=UPI00360C52B0